MPRHARRLTAGTELHCGSTPLRRVSSPNCPFVRRMERKWMGASAVCACDGTEFMRSIPYLCCVPPRAGSWCWSPTATVRSARSSRLRRASRACRVCRRSREPPKEPPAICHDQTNRQGGSDLVVVSELVTELPVLLTDGTNVDGFLNAECASASCQLIGNSPYIFDLPRTVSLIGHVPAPWRRSIGESRE